MASITIAFSPGGGKVRVRQGTNVLNAAIEGGVALRAECGGNGICGKCRVIVRDLNSTNKSTRIEKKHLSSHELDSGYRLACQTYPKRDIHVLIPRETRIGKRKVLVQGYERQTRLNPMIRKYHVKLEKPSLFDIRSDFERLTKVLSASYRLNNLVIDYGALRELPDILRDSDWDVTVTIWCNERIIAVETGETTEKSFGFAVDIGTSKVVGHLVDLTTGKTVSTAYTENPQMPYGADIITRIAFAMEKEINRETLRKAVIEGINKVLRQTCLKAKVDMNQIYQTVLVGNTAMHHLCLGIQPRYIALSPFVPATKGSVDLPAEQLHVNMNRNGVCSFLPIIGGFVGADAVADMIATSFYQLKKVSMLIDIGTNTEVFVGNSKDIVTCSCASGPAFEGARIKHGMKAETGAIESLCLNSDFDVEFKTIGKTKPRGLCGSAMIDVVGEMFKSGIVDSRGRISSDLKTSRLRRTDKQMEFVIAWANETGINRDIVITQKDIGEIQLAKAAIFAGCSALMKTRNLRQRDLDRVLVAGSFGSHINPENAKLLGLVPDVATNRIEFVGNTSVTGAKMALVSKETRETAERISKEIRYLELATAPEFSKELTDAMFIPHRDPDRFPRVGKYLTNLKKKETAQA
jgi:uncharacterized 2Fe-2S/4Fe-4S cluster protein (DUF4445 family)